VIVLRRLGAPDAHALYTIATIGYYHIGLDRRSNWRRCLQINFQEGISSIHLPLFSTFLPSIIIIIHIRLLTPLV